MGNAKIMKTHLVSFSTPQYRLSQKALVESALKFGIDVIHSFTEKDLKKTDFYRANIEIFKQSRGYGYWLWKPFLILNTLKKVSEGDIVIYIDSGNTIISNLQPLFDLCYKEQSVLFFQAHGHLNKTWVKRDAFVLMDCDSDVYYEAQQVCGSPNLFLANHISINFLEDWLFFCQKASILTDSPNTCGLENDFAFQDHRHDQAVLSLLALKNNIKIYRDPSQFGNDFYKEFPNSTYEQVLDLHRTKHYSLIERIKMKIKRTKIKITNSYNDKKYY